MKFTTFDKKYLFLVVVLSLNLFWVQTVNSVEARKYSSGGEIVRENGDAAIQFVATADWLTAKADQNLLAGDNIRTGKLGAMSLLFADRTQISVHRNSFMTVKAIASTAGRHNTILQLNRGSIWSRAT